jgi:hypothetical protein
MRLLNKDQGPVRSGAPAAATKNAAKHLPVTLGKIANQPANSY